MSTYQIGEVCIVVWNSEKLLVLGPLVPCSGGKSIYSGEKIGPCHVHKVMRLRDGMIAFARPRDMRKHAPEQLVSWTEVMNDCGWLPTGVSR